MNQDLLRNALPKRIRALNPETQEGRAKLERIMDGSATASAVERIAAGDALLSYLRRAIPGPQAVVFGAMQEAAIGNLKANLECGALKLTAEEQAELFTYLSAREGLTC